MKWTFFPARARLRIRWGMLAFLITMIALLSPAHGQNGTYHGESRWAGWRFRLGGTRRRINGLRISPGASYVQQQGLSSNGTGDTVLGRVGPENAPADRAYDDGYVNQDAGTPVDGQTWFWGYNNAAQYDGTPGSETLTFSAANLIDQTATNNQSFYEDGDSGSPGFRISVDRPLRQVGPFTMLFGFDLSADRIDTDATWEPYREEVYTVTDVYDVSAIAPPGSTVPPFTAPYAGTVAGPGPIISNTPDVSRTMTPDWSARNTVNLDVELTMITIAPSIGLEKTVGRVRCLGRVGPSLTWARLDVTRTERWYRQMPGGGSQPLASWEQDNEESALIPGAMAELAAEVQITECWFAGAAARWDQPFTSIDTRVGPDELTAHLAGVSGSIYLGFSF